MNYVNINTLDDSRLDPYARLTDVQLRSRIEPEKAVFIAESAEVIGRARIDGHRVSGTLDENWNRSPQLGARWRASSARPRLHDCSYGAV